ncbi:MAG: hypothetical protein IPO58_00200 [Betaproteobacteria bacterium]|nr:hypothetical protein [Betaproteobacteria bacterium]
MRFRGSAARTSTTRPFTAAAAASLGISVFPTSTYFDAGQEAHSHEIGHQWINFLPQASLSIGTPHWPLSSLASGLMGFSIPGSGAGGDYSCRLTSIPTGVQLTAFSGARSFSDLDLYLMGLKSAAQVADHYVWKDQQAAMTQNCLGVANYAQFNKVTINDVIAVAGPRSPAYPAAQRDFKVAVIVLSDAKITPEAMAYTDYFAQRADARAAERPPGVPFRRGQSVLRRTGGAERCRHGCATARAPGTFVTVFEFYAPLARSLLPHPRTSRKPTR